MDAITANWPLIASAMAARGLWDKENAAAVAATVAIETAHTFQPVKEAFWLPESWRAANLRYYPWYGRGFIQLTWQDAYQKAQAELGIPVHDNPEAAMEPGNAAAILANFWDYKEIAPYARVRMWHAVRSRVQGGDAGVGELIAHAEGLLAA